LKIFYTTNGKEPDIKSSLYSSPFEMKNQCIVKAKAFTGDMKLSSKTVTAEFGVSKEKWKIVSVSDEHPQLKGELAIDDDPSTFWHTHWSGDYKKQPHEIVIDFGEALTLKGFTYLPRQDGNNSGNITEYDLYLSTDNVSWKKEISGGRFANIVNNPILQTVLFANNEKAHYFKIITKGDANNNGWVNAAEIGVITQ
jgi:alpha-L-fucosidase